MRFRKKGGLVTDLISGTGNLIIIVVIILVVVSTILGANLLTSNSVYNSTAHSLASNFTDGIGEVSSKIPTILLIGAVVLLFGVLVFLVARAKAMGIGAGGGSL